MAEFRISNGVMINLKKPISFVPHFQKSSLYSTYEFNKKSSLVKNIFRPESTSVLNNVSNRIASETQTPKGKLHNSGSGNSGTENSVVTGAPPVVGSGQVARQSAVSNVSPTNILYKGITIISKGGDVNFIKRNLDKLPQKVLTVLASKGVKIVAVKDSITEYFTRLKGVHPRGWTSGATWDSVPGGLYEGVVVVATSGKFPTSTVNLVLHEIGHAYDEVKGYPSKQTSFISASSSILSGSWYFTHQSSEENQSEKFAETFARYYGGYTKISSSASHYWRNYE